MSYVAFHTRIIWVGYIVCESRYIWTSHGSVFLCVSVSVLVGLFFFLHCSTIYLRRVTCECATIGVMLRMNESWVCVFVCVRVSARRPFSFLHCSATYLRRVTCECVITHIWMSYVAFPTRIIWVGYIVYESCYVWTSHGSVFLCVSVSALVGLFSCPTVRESESERVPYPNHMSGVYCMWVTLSMNESWVCVFLPPLFNNVFEACRMWLRHNHISGIYCIWVMLYMNESWVCVFVYVHVCARRPFFLPSHSVYSHLKVIGLFCKRAL